LFVVGTFSFQNQSKIEALEKSRDRGQLKWYAEMAKAKGQHEVAFPAPIALYGVARNLDEAAAHFNVVLAEPVQHKFYAVSDDGILTWYKMRLIEELSTPIVSCTNCDKIADVPSDMLPLADDEFLVAQSGGEVEIDGIRIISRNIQFPAFEHRKRYLLFLSLDSERKIGSLQMGPWGAFALDATQNFKPVNEKLTHPLSEELKTKFDSVSKLRIRIKARSKPTLSE
jgi:hypothetical protein